MSAGIFISYRRGDARHAAGRLADDLAAAFGADSIFRDIDGIDLGVNFAQALERALSACKVMLVVIGPQWLDARDEQGRRRLDLPTDWVRLEIASALARDIPVVPVLLEGEALPAATDLPSDLAELAQRQKVDLSDDRWRGDVQSLIDRLSRLPGLRRQVPPHVAAPAAASAPASAAGMAAWKKWAGGAAGLAVSLAMVNEWSGGGGNLEGNGAFQGAGTAPPATQPLVNNPPVAARQDAPTVAPARTEPAPEVRAEVRPPALAAPQVPDVSGLWRSLTGENYQFEQSGRALRFMARANGMVVGQGEAELDANGLLRMSLNWAFNGQVGSALCNLQLAADARSMIGTCLGPQGQFPAQLFR